jgi:hypothetical protein
VSTFAFAALVFAAAALVVGFETAWAKAVPDHAADPNNMAAKPASVCARANLIVSICCSPMFQGASRVPLVIDDYWTDSAHTCEVIMSAAAAMCHIQRYTTRATQRFKLQKILLR